MSSKFKDIKFPDTFKYSSDSEHIPLEFYLDTFPISKRIDLLLGYFSSNAFKLLAPVMAQFIYNGGTMRIVTNHVYSLKDKEKLIDQINIANEDKVISTFNDLSELKKTLEGYGEHFFDCLRYLLNTGRLQLTPVKFNGVDLAHCKKMILFDGIETISTDGSINFTLNALTKNSESFEVNAPWNGEIFRIRTEKEVNNFEKIINKSHNNYEFIESSEIETVINTFGRNKSEIDLISDSLNLQNDILGKRINEKLKQQKEKFEILINKKNGLPCFPFESGPREYQSEAYTNWMRSNFSGVFCMATGTGKTITSLNCLLNEYKKTNTYKAIILVPSIALLAQWEKEVGKFNFKNILKVGGGNKWEASLGSYVSNYVWGKKSDLIIIATYGSFAIDRFQKYFQKVQNEFILIADEAHNMGASNIKKTLNILNVAKKIGLSATPKRIYDEEGTKAIESFFKDSPPYTYNFGIEKALKREYLSDYTYFPRIVQLSDDEYKKYIEISKKLLKYFDFERGAFRKDEPIVEKLLLLRKSIIHKAKNKINELKYILKELEKKKKLKYVFTYVPEGYIKTKNDEPQKIIDLFIKGAVETIHSLKVNSYTTADDNLQDLLRGFSEGKIDVLFAMKMLDEGIDVPRAEVGIFCSSTGNPRQYIQRRGRLLRKHEDKAFSTIYDMVVVPGKTSDKRFFKMEQNMVKSELRRVAYFASLSMNFYDTKEALENICAKYELNIDELILEL